MILIFSAIKFCLILIFLPCSVVHSLLHRRQCHLDRHVRSMYFTAYRTPFQRSPCRLTTVWLRHAEREVNQESEQRKKEQNQHSEQHDQNASQRAKAVVKQDQHWQRHQHLQYELILCCCLSASNISETLAFIPSPWFRACVWSDAMKTSYVSDSIYLSTYVIYVEKWMSTGRF